MILSCNVSLQTLATRQKKYPWQRPAQCPGCQGATLWGHGFVSRYFNGHSGPIFLKRWRCPHCPIVITCRPATYWRRFQESISGIFEALMARAKGARWPPWVPRQRGGYWLRLLLENAKLHGMMKSSLAKTISWYSTKNLVIF